MQCPQEHLKTIVYAKFGGQTKCIMGTSKIENTDRFFFLLKEGVSTKVVKFPTWLKGARDSLLLALHEKNICHFALSSDSWGNNTFIN